MSEKPFERFKKNAKTPKKPASSIFQFGAQVETKTPKAEAKPQDPGTAAAVSDFKNTEPPKKRPGRPPKSKSE